MIKESEAGQIQKNYYLALKKQSGPNGYKIDVVNKIKKRADG
jgi:hypothetical protein